MIIRGEVFQADIPVHFNPRSPFNAYQFIRNLQPALRDILDEEARSSIQAIYNGFFVQASDMAINWTTWCAPPRPGLVSSLIHGGWGDLRASCQAFSLHDPTAVLFTAQQGPEKYLKAMILVDDPTFTEETIRKNTVIAYRNSWGIARKSTRALLGSNSTRTCSIMDLTSAITAKTSRSERSSPSRTWLTHCATRRPNGCCH